jgi:hypothetical protein
VTTKPHEPEPKKPYAPPRLVAYGSVTKLTQGTGGSRADGGPGIMTMSCL